MPKNSSPVPHPTTPATLPHQALPPGVTVLAFRKVKEPYGWLGNMAPYPVTAEGVSWRTNEALFQALRFSDPEVREAIRRAKSPMQAKFVAKRYKDRQVIEPMGPEDCEHMRNCLQLKIESYPFLRTRLLQTEDALLYEDVSARVPPAQAVAAAQEESRLNGTKQRSLFWGALRVGDHLYGHNTLGRLWMELREACRA